MAWDAKDGYLLLFGGARYGPSGNIAYNDTWIWASNGWRQLNPPVSPPGRTLPAMAFDEGSQRVLLFGGGSVNSDPYRNDTWAWDGLTWTSQNPAHTPPILGFSAIGYDPVGRQVVLFGGKTDSLDGAPVLDQTWTWNGSDWQPR
jgi:hypothetical protein